MTDEADKPSPRPDDGTQRDDGKGPDRLAAIASRFGVTESFADELLVQTLTNELRAKRRPGRPTGPAYDDSLYLRYMADLRVLFPKMSRRAAAQRAAEEAKMSGEEDYTKPTTMFPSLVARFDRRFKENEGELMSAARLRDPRPAMPLIHHLAERYRTPGFNPLSGEVAFWTEQLSAAGHDPKAMSVVARAMTLWRAITDDPSIE